MFSNVFKVVMSLSLLTAVSATAQEVRDYSKDSTLERDNKGRQETVNSGKTFKTMDDQGKEQSKQLHEADSNSAVKAFGSGATSGNKDDISIFRLQVKSTLAEKTVMNAGRYRNAIGYVVDAYKISAEEGKKALSMVKHAVVELNGADLSPAAIEQASILIEDMAHAEILAAGEKGKTLSVDSASEMVKTYVIDVEKVSGKNRSDFKAAHNADLIEKDLVKNYATYKAQAIAEGAHVTEIFTRCQEKAAYSVIANFHSLDKNSVNYMSEQDMRELAKEIVEGKSCLS